MATQDFTKPGAQSATGQSYSNPSTARDLFDRADEHARRWLSIIESTLETHQFAPHVFPEPREPLPQWAVDRLNDGGVLARSASEYRMYREMLLEAFRLASGDGSNTRYEIWDPRPQGRFVRLEIRSESLQEARDRLDKLGERFPTAYIVQVDVRHTGGGVTDPALYDTLVGRLWHAGTSFAGDGDEVFEIQDETGRSISIEAQALRQHPMLERLSAEARESVEASLKHTERKLKLQADARANGEQGQA